MPSLLPILSYDVPSEDGAGSILGSNDSSSVVFKGEHSTSSGSVLKKHTTVCQELPEKKKKSSKHVKTHDETSAGVRLPESVVTDHEEARETVVKTQGIADAVKLMKTAVFTVQMALFNGLKSNLQLQAATCLLTQSEYADVVTERSNDKQCGYPLCTNALKTDKTRRGRYHISLREHKVYDLEETRPFCSTLCAVTSKTYGSSLPVTHEEIVEHQKLEEIIACVRGLSLTASPKSKMTGLAQQNDGVIVHERNASEVGEFEFPISPGAIEGYTPRKYVSQDSKPLKSAIKQSPRKHQRITWADEVVQTDDSFSFVTDNVTKKEDSEFSGVTEVEPIQDLDEQGMNRLEMAQNVAEALSKAARASSFGEVEACQAASTAGISIISASEEPAAAPAVAAVEEPSVVDTELVDECRSSWYDTPPKGFKAEVSMFGLIFMALDGWVTTATLAYIYGRDSVEEFRNVNGRVTADNDGLSSAEILRTISSCVSRALPDVVQALGVSVPISVIEQAVGRLLRTMNLVEALPPLTTKHWRMLSVLFLDALSVHCLDALAGHLVNNRALLRKIVNNYGTSDSEYESYKELLLPLGRLPSFSTMGGG